MSRVAVVADDSISIRQMISATLRDAGFEVLEAGHGQEALDLMEDRSISVVITDLNMPMMDGATLIRELRAKPETKFTPIVVSSSEAPEGSSLGATAWLVKPFTPERIMRAVDKLTRRELSPSA